MTTKNAYLLVLNGSTIAGDGENLGPNIVANGDFAGGESEWTASSNPNFTFSVSGGVATLALSVAGSANIIQRAIVTEPGTYQFQMTGYTNSPNEYRFYGGVSSGTSFSFLLPSSYATNTSSDTTTATFEVPEGVEYLLIGLEVKGTSGTMEAYISDYSIKRVGGAKADRTFLFTDHVPGFHTAPSNSVAADKYADPRILSVGDISEAMVMSLLVNQSSNVPVFGDIVLDNTDGALNSFADMTFQEQAVSLYRGPVDEEPIDGANWSRVFSGFVRTVTVDDSVRVFIRSKAEATNKSLQTATFLGTSTSTGGTEGDASLLGQIKPVIAGGIYNVEPVLVNRADLVYALSFDRNGGRAFGSGDLRDGGASLTGVGNFSDYAALMAATVGSGEFATCHNEGLIRAGAAPTYVHHCTTAAGTANNYVGPVVSDLFDNYGRGVSSSDVDADSITNLGSFPEAAGFWAPGTTTLAAAVQAVVECSIGYTAWSADGKLYFDVVPIPEDETADYSLDESGIVDLRVSDRTQFARNLLPGSAVRLGAGRNWNVRDQSEVNPSASDSDQAKLTSRAFTWYYFPVAEVGDRYPQAEQIEFITSGLGNLSGTYDLKANVKRIADRFCVPREAFEVDFVPSNLDGAFSMRCGQIMELKTDRLGLSSDGKNFLIVKLNKRLGGRDGELFTATLWG